MPLAPSRRIGVYEILGHLGAGGMGEVYRARDTRLGRIVAIKFLSSDALTDRYARERLAREAQLASSLNHPNIVTVYDIGEEEGHPFIVMELIEGESLYRRLITKSLKTREVLDIACQVADGLAAAHGAGVVHRDLKPQNIMLTTDGRAKIVDFGLSKQAPGSSGPDELTAKGSALTADHLVLGSAGYMAPEQVAGQVVDGRADQFALGAVLYEMLSGKRAFKKGTSVQTMASIIEDEPPSLFDLSPAVPEPVVALVERCLAKSPDRRYASTYDLARDLHDLRDGIVSGARSSTRAVPPRPQPRRWWLAAAVVAVAAAAIGASLLMRERPTSAVQQAATPAIRLIAVLPFTNVTRDPVDQVFCEGLVETLASSLTQLERFQRTLRVVPASEVRREQAASAKEAHDAFGALQRGPSSVRLTLNLVDAVQLHQLASRTITVVPGQDEKTQDSVIDVTTALLDLQLDPEARRALTAGGTSGGEAYQQYVQGRGYLQRFDRAENIDLAIERFTRAISADSQYALAHAGLGEAYWRKYESDGNAAWIERAVDSCGQALKIDDRLAPVHVTLALIARGRGRYEEAVAVAGRAIELDPLNSDGYRELGRAYEALNQPADAEATYQRAIRARNDDWLAYNTLGSFYYARARYAEAETAYRRVLELTPDNTRAYNNLGATLFALRRPEEGAAMWERSVALRPTYSAVSNLGTYYYDRGRYTDAARSFERAVTLMPNDHRVWRNLGAALYWAPGERDKAAAAYERAVALAEQARKINPRQIDLLAQLADGYSMLGRQREAREAAIAVEQLGPKDPAVLYMLTGVYEQLGDRAAALAWLEKALAAGYQRERVERSPSLAELRKDERYLRLLTTR
jgi:tetratricopeptide (TPR) repeat protein/tRNA A-37 threonylcarbamoyl transferase component Bud32